MMKKGKGYPEHNKTVKGVSKGYPTHLPGKPKQTFGDTVKITEDKWGKLSNRGVLNEWALNTSYEWPNPKKGSRKNTM
jgi:hypothetical protein